ncbi:MAG: tRNA (adenosine(37)-N6)-dimethylallyltransferase MiaA, partial [Muribaculaceae bacterium]|nr:tRNA (adenosine(37)-N6)-dimethylallyltransferase MiaA [Muribaculaceae bacterium]
MGRPPILVITGPTASGKTRRAVDCARALGGEIISADSRQVYRGMDIGTGKDVDEYGDVPYHLIDIAQPGEKYNLYRYLDDYDRALNDIYGRNSMPVLCGGTGLYVESAINGVKLPQVPENRELRASLRGKSLEELTSILASMKVLHNVTDVDSCQRAIRAIEIQTYYAANDCNPQPLTIAAHDTRTPAVVVGVDIDREARRERITQRLHNRLDQGMVDEVRRLIDGGVAPDDLIYYGLEYKYLTLYVIGE